MTMERFETLVELVESLPRFKGIAISYHNGFRTFRYSYPELYTLVRKCASLYRALGLREGARIAIWGPNRPEWAIAYFGAVYAGMVPVPIDIQSTKEAAEAIVRHCDAELLVQSTLRKPFSLGIEAVTLEDMEFAIAGCAPAAAHKAHPNDMAEIVYTSGTTGDPKGVMLTHDNLVANVRGILSHLHISERDSILALLPYSHMFGQTCSLLAPVAAGMRIVMIGSLTARSMFDALGKEQVTIILAVPRIVQGIRAGIEATLRETRAGRLLARLPRALRAFVIRGKFGRSLRFFVSGGAALDAATAEYFKKLGLKVLAGYGLTETSPILTAETEGEASGISAGRAIPGVELKLGSDGEIRAKGRNIFSGYYNDPQRTADVFCDGYFLTGDFGRFEDGRLFINGRKKETIVTSAGVNVYPDDVESVLNEVRGVKESCVVGMPTKEGEEVHAVIIAADTKPDIARIVRMANERLNSSQQIVSASLWGEAEFPKTSTLKIKRGYVRSRIAQSAAQRSNEGAASKLAGIIARVTGVPANSIAPTSRLYGDLKLDSIGRIELASLITQEYFFDFDEDHIDQHTTVADLERIIATRAKAAPRFSFPRWPHWKIMVLARIIGMELVTANISRLFARVRVEGAHHLNDLRGPVIFAANHVSYADHSIIFRSLPLRYRYRIAAPAFAEFFSMPKDTPLIMRLWKRFTYYWGAATMALYPTSELFSSKRALEHTGSLIDQGESILIFPEAERTQTARMLPFRKGTAILVKNLRVPVVPIGHRGLEYVFPRGAAVPRFGRAVVHIGAPIHFGAESIEEITERLEAQVDALRNA